MNWLIHIMHIYICMSKQQWLANNLDWIISNGSTIARRRPDQEATPLKRWRPWPPHGIIFHKSGWLVPASSTHRHLTHQSLAVLGILSHTFLWPCRFWNKWCWVFFPHPSHRHVRRQRGVSQSDHRWFWTSKKAPPFQDLFSSSSPQ